MQIIAYDDAYTFNTDQNGVATFTKKNIRYVSGILRYDSDYSVTSDKDSAQHLSSYAGLLENTPDFLACHP